MQKLHDTVSSQNSNFVSHVRKQEKEDVHEKEESQSRMMDQSEKTIKNMSVVETVIQESNSSSLCKSTSKTGNFLI